MQITTFLSGAAGGTIQFKDPWLIDFADPDFGNELRNQGMEAPFKQRTAPFNPDFTTSYNGDVYQGVFTGQGSPDWAPPYYSVKADQTQTVAFHGEAVDWYFQGWGGSNVTFQNASALQTPVVFNTSNATVKAIYKADFVSSASNVTAASGGARHIVTRNGWDPSYENQIPGLFVTYEDGGEIFFKYSRYYYGKPSAGNPHWEPYQLLSDGSGNSSKPALAIQEWGSDGWQLNLVWQQYNPATSRYDIMLQQSALNSATTWQAAQVIGHSSSVSACPVVAAARDNYPLVAATWYTGNALGFWSANGTATIPSTNTASKNPAIVINDQADVVLAWEQSSHIYYSRFSMYGSPTAGGNITSSYANLRNHTLPGLALAADQQTIMLAWQAETEYSISGGSGLGKISGGGGTVWYKQVYSRKRNIYGNWSTLTSHVIPDKQGLTPTVGSVGNDFELLWKVKDEGLVRRMVYSNGSWSTPATNSYSASSLRYPTLTSGSDRSMVLMTYYSDAPYFIDYKNQTAGLDIQKTSVVENQELLQEITLPFSQIDPQLSGYATLRIYGLYCESEAISLRPQEGSIIQSEPIQAETGAENMVTLHYELFAAGYESRQLENQAGLHLFEIRNIETGQATHTDLLVSLAIDKLFNSDSLFQADWLEEHYLSSFAAGSSYIRATALPAEPLPMNIVVMDASDAAFSKAAAENQETGAQVVTSFKLHNAWPNPFNPSTHIRFDLPEDGLVKLSVYTITGQKLGDLAGGYYRAGRHIVYFDATGLASGIYIYRLQAGEKIEQKKMLLVR
jgi:hypothetical protein